MRHMAVLKGVAVLMGVMAFSGAAWATDDSGKAQGVWQFQSAVYTPTNGKPVQVKAGELVSTKIISGKRFAFVTTDGKGGFIAASSGTFRLADGEYHETVTQSSIEKARQQTYHFKAKLEGDVWRHSGDEDGTHIEEVWVRVK